MKKITEEDKEKVLDLYFNKQLNFSKIAKRLNLSRPTVYIIIK